MKRRDFLTAMGGVTAISMMKMEPHAFADNTTSLFVKGLVMVSFEDSQVVRLGFPKAPGHQGTMTVLPQTGSRQVFNIKGNGSVDAKALAFSAPRTAIPALVSMKEFYGNLVSSHIADCPTVISIPKAAIKSIVTDQVSQSRYTFVRKDTGQEVNSFRPRQIAESIRIELSSAGSLRLEKNSIALASVREMRLEYLPTPASVEAARKSGSDSFVDHFHHYLMYVNRPASANFDVVPKRLGGGPSPSSPKGNSFYWPYVYCYMVEVG